MTPFIMIKYFHILKETEKYTSFVQLMLFLDLSSYLKSYIRMFTSNMRLKITDCFTFVWTIWTLELWFFVTFVPTMTLHIIFTSVRTMTIWASKSLQPT